MAAVDDSILSQSSFWSAVVQSMIRKVFLCMKVSSLHFPHLESFLAALPTDEIKVTGKRTLTVQSALREKKEPSVFLLL